jgi:hypothetical protein
MLSFDETILGKLSIHHIGNKSRDEGLIASDKPVDVEDDVRALLTKYFTQAFKESSFHHFHHPEDLSLNEVYVYLKEIFNDPDTLHFQSLKIARHLYESSNHPNIKPGELYITWLENCKVDGEITEAIGIFKSENKQTYLKVYPQNSAFAIEKEEGININKLDKGCLIYNLDAENGYRSVVIDHTNRGDEARFWVDDFLQMRPVEDAYFHTRNYMQMCRDFSVEAFPEADKIDKLALVNESNKFFDHQEVFDKKEFHEQVLQSPELIDAFETYKDAYQSEKNIPVYDEFDINSQAVKKLKRVFKSVIKLDKNFHIYVHGNRDLIKKGYDEESGLHFYQVFFKTES